MNAGEIGMRGRIEPAQKEIVNPGTAELPWRQADAVYHQQGDIVYTGSLVVVQ